MTQISTVSFVRFKGFRQKWWAFQRMGIYPQLLKDVEGLAFAKMLGTGGGTGFSVLPDWEVYALLSIWNSEEEALHFYAHHPLWKDYESKSSQQQILFLKNTMAHGQWEGQQPFKIAETYNASAPAVILTRATIKPKFLLHFWRSVPAPSKDILGRKGLVFHKGVGELPLVQQATISLWESGSDMMAYAYKDKAHGEVIKKTRALGWYKEELFARFQPYGQMGNGFFEWKEVPMINQEPTFGIAP